MRFALRGEEVNLKISGLDPFFGTAELISSGECLHQTFENLRLTDGDGMGLLKGIPQNLSPELLYAIAKMGHGDEIVLGDANFPSRPVSVHFPV